MTKFKRRDFIKSGSLLTGGLLSTFTLSSFASKSLGQSIKPFENQILDAIMNRRSVRSYQATPVPDKHLKMILEAARMAPTSGNQQPWKFVITKKPETIKKLKQACIENSMNRFKSKGTPSEKDIQKMMERSKTYFDNCFSASVYITILTDNQSKYPSYNHWDGPLATANLMVAARALGYGTVHYVDSVPAHINKKVLNIPDRYERVCFTPLGVPTEWPDTPKKNDYESFIIEDSF